MPPGEAARLRAYLGQAFAGVYKGGWRALVVGTLLTTAALFSVAWGVALSRMEAEARLALDAATRQQANVALVVAENLSQVLDRGRLMSLAASDASNGRRGGLGRTLAGMLVVDAAFVRAAVYSRDGRRIFASSEARDMPAITADISRMLGETGLRVRIADAAARGDLAWQVPVLYPIAGGGERPAGVLLAVLDLGYLLELYRDIDIGPTGVVRVLRQDGVALAEMDRAGLAMMPASLDLQWFSGTASASRVERLFADRREYITSYHPVARFPLVVAVSREIDDVNAGQTEAHRWLRRILLGVSAVILLAALWVVGNLLRQHQLLQSLRRANEDNRDLITRLEDEKQRAFRLASHDHLTGLCNRRMFAELSASHLARARRSHRQYAVLYLDLDRFKGINDTLGHHVGDLLLISVAGRLRDVLRESDVIARLGGDEFAVLLTGLNCVEDVAGVAAKLVDAIGMPYPDLDGHQIQVGTSIGIAIFPRDGQTVDVLCRHADAAMYVSKRAGRGRFTFHDAALNPAGEWRFGVEQLLPKALAQEELVLHFQPKVRVADYRIVGLEALVRWQHPEHGLIYPKDFVPIAEECGQIIALGRWVIDACCRQLATWRAAGVPLVPIAFNASSHQLADPKLADWVGACLDRHGIAGEWLEIEITETALIASVEDAGAALAQLVRHGLRVALDDFGKGYSNLGHIRALPIDTLKIDQSFVADLRCSTEDRVIVDSIISLAHSLQLQVVAEGVESTEQLVHLRTAGCDQVQGYLLSRPVPADAARALIANEILKLS